MALISSSRFSQSSFASYSFYHKVSENKVRTSTLSNTRLRWQIHCTMNAAKQSYDATTEQRRFVTFQPTSWTYEFIQSIGDTNNPSRMEDAAETMTILKQKVRLMLDDNNQEPLVLLEFVDDIHRLGLGHLFKQDTFRALDRINRTPDDVRKQIQKSNLHGCALYFRLLRQHGFNVSTDVFDSFKDENGNFYTSLSTDVQGLLSLYEASHHAFDDDACYDFARFHLQNIDLAKIDMNVAMQVRHALEVPFHRRMQRLEARWNIETFSKSSEANRLLHALSKLEFNSVQLTHQQELKGLSTWWRKVGLANKLSFARERLMESFFWSVGMTSQPRHGKCRDSITKAVKLVTVIDDVYDVYGSLDELEHFTDVVDRWDINEANRLPDYMKLCFIALYNTINDMAYDTLKDHDKFIVPHLRKVWADLCKAFLREAKWSYKKHSPTFDEYLDHGWVSSSGVVLLTHVYFTMTENIKQEAVDCLNDSHNLLLFPCTIFRLTNDLNSTKEDLERGETAKAVPCYVNETGESEEAARTHIRKIVDECWKLMNKEMVHNSVFEKPFIEIAMNLARIAQCQYQYGDAHSHPDDMLIKRVLSVIVDPIEIVDEEKLITVG